MWLTTRAGKNISQPTQYLYHVPLDWLTTDGSPNLFTLFEELPVTQRSVQNVAVVISQMLQTAHA